MESTSSISGAHQIRSECRPRRPLYRVRPHGRLHVVPTLRLRSKFQHASCKIEYRINARGVRNDLRGVVESRRGIAFMYVSDIGSSEFSTLIAFFNADSDVLSSISTSNALPAAPMIAQKSFTIFYRAGR